MTATTTTAAVHIRRHGNTACGVQVRKGVLFARTGLSDDFTRVATCKKCLKLASTHTALWAAQDAAWEAEQAAEAAQQAVEEFLGAVIAQGLKIATAWTVGQLGGRESLVACLDTEQFRSLWADAVVAAQALVKANATVDREATPLRY
jgi:hypothetical protein